MAPQNGRANDPFIGGRRKEVDYPLSSLTATKGREAPAQQTVLFDKANAALDRIEIPQDTVERISELLMPASSFIISDNGFSRETGKDTDFIVVTH